MTLWEQLLRILSLLADLPIYCVSFIYLLFLSPSVSRLCPFLHLFDLTGVAGAGPSQRGRHSLQSWQRAHGRHDHRFPHVSCFSFSFFSFFPFLTHQAASRPHLCSSSSVRPARPSLYPSISLATHKLISSYLRIRSLLAHAFTHPGFVSSVFVYL